MKRKSKSITGKWIAVVLAVTLVFTSDVSAWSEIITWATENENEEEVDAYVLTGTEGDNGWYRSEVTVSNREEDSQGYLFATSEEELKNGEGKDSLTLEEEGENKFYMQATDGTITEGPSVNIDTVAPTIEKVSQQPEFVTNGTEVTITIEGASDDSGSGLADKPYQYDGGEWTEDNTYSYTYNSDEKTGFSYKVRDKAGNTVDATNVDASGVDTEAPEITKVEEPKKYAQSSVTYKFSVKDNDKVAAYVWVKGEQEPEKIEEDNWITVDNKDQIETEATENGVYTFAIKDQVGNITSQTVEVSKIDTDEPTISVKADTEEATNQDVALTISVSDKTSGIAEVDYVKTGEDGKETETVINANDGVYTKTVSENGTYNFRVKDNAGRTASSSITVQNIDKEGPIIESVKYVNYTKFLNSLLGIGDTVYFATQPITVLVKATDEGVGMSTVILKVNNDGQEETYEPNSVSDGTYQFMVPASGLEEEKEFSSQIQIIATDTLKNSSTYSGVDGKTEAVVIENIKPTVEVSYDNNEVENDKYFVGERKATITVTEKYFEDSELNLDGITVNNSHVDGKTDADIVKALKKQLAKENWTKVENTDLYTATLTFTEDAEYTFDLVVTDPSGNCNVDESNNSIVAYAKDTKAGKTFIIDKTAPTVEVVYDNNEAENDKYFAQGRTATITVTDSYFEDSELNLDGITVNNSHADGKTDADIAKALKEQLAKENWTKVENTDSYTATLTFTEDAEYTFDLICTDLAGNSNTDKSKNSQISYAKETKAGKEFIIDKTAPTVEVVYDNNEAENDKYFAKGRTATITVTDSYFEDSELNLDGITVNNSHADGKTDADIAKALKKQLAKKNWTKVENTDSYTATLTFTEDAEYTFDLICTDLAGNSNTDKSKNSQISYAKETKAGKEFIIDKTAPTVEVVYDNNEVENDKYFAKGRTATITVTDSYFEDSELNLDGITVKNSHADGKTDADIAKALKEQLAKENWKKVENTDSYTATLTFTEDAEYTFDLVCTDLAGKSNTDESKNSQIAYSDNTKAPADFVVDKNAPEISSVEYSDLTKSLEKLFGIEGWFGFSNVPVTVTVTATDAFSGIDRVVLKAGEYKETKDGTEDNRYTFILPKKVLSGDTDFNEVVEITAVDKAGNSIKYQRKDEKQETLVVEDIKPVVSVEYDNNDAENDKFFAKERTATITVKERYFEDSTLKLDGITVTNSNVEGKTNADIATAIKAQLSKDKWTLKEGTNDTYIATVTFKEDAEYNFDLVVTDPARNSNTETTGESIINYKAGTKASAAFVIDKTAPQVTVSYDNNEVTNEKYFAKERVATIKVTERYFSEDSLNLNLDGITVANNNAENKSNKEIGEELNAQLAKAQWTQIGNTDEYEATLEFVENGEYTFDLIVTDSAGNSNVETAGKSIVQYDKNTEAGTTFIIDKTIPIVTVAYENNEVKNDKYFSEGRKAIITVKDRYFEDSTLNLSGITVKNSNADGKTNKDIVEELKAQLAKDKWSSTGELDTYTATVTFTEDAEYTFDFVYKNAAGTSNQDATGNSIVDYTDSVAPTAFIIDTKKPVITLIDSNANKTGKYYAKEKTITITVEERYFEDAQLDLDGIKVTNSNADNKTDEDIETAIKAQLAKSKWTQNGDIYTTKVTFSEDAEYAFTIGCTDSAGNNSKLGVTEYVIVKKSPIVIVSYDNNDVANGKYFAKGRTATITVTERYFTDCTLNLDGITVKNSNVAGKTDTSIANNLKAQLAKTEWSNVEGTDDYTATVTFEEDAEYTFDLKCTNVSGKSNVDSKGKNIITYEDGTEAPTAFVVDKTVPVVKVSYNNNSVKNEKYFAKERTATIKVTEHYFKDSSLSLSGITVKNNNASGKKNDDIKKELDAQLAKAKWTNVEGTDEYTAILKFTDDAEYTFDFICTDLAGNSNVDSKNESVITYTNGTKVPTAFIIDTTAPVIEVSYNNNSVQNDKYFAKKRTATIVVTERYFSGSTLDLSGITVKSSNVDGKTNKQIKEELLAQLAESKWTKKAGTDQYSAKITFAEDANYTFDFICTDLAENASTDSKGNSKITYAKGTQAATSFIVDKTDPVVKVYYDNNDVVNGKYFVDTRNAYIEIEDHNFSKKGAVVTVSAYSDAKYEKPLKGWKAPTVTFQKVADETDTYAAEVAFDEDVNAFYKFEVSFTDLAGNSGTTKYVDEREKKAKAPTAFCIDTAAPTGTIYVSQNKAASISDAKVIAKYRNKLRDSKYGVYQANPVYILFEQSDELSGLDTSKVQYYVSTTVLEKEELNDVKWKKVIGTNKIQVSPKIATGRDVIVYLKVTDKAGNCTYVNTNRIVVDGENPVDTLSPEVTVNPQQPVNGFYNGDVKVSISALDPAQKDNKKNDVYSGLSEVSFQVVGENELKDENAYAQNVVFTGKKTKPQQSYETTITVKATHDVTLWVRAVDQAGRITEQECSLKIDTTAPQVTISYDNNSADSNKLFKENRTATITVRERNFSKQQFDIQITKNGTAYSPTLQWQESGSGDDTLHRATIVFSEDGDYVINGVTCEDDAGNNTTTYTQEQGTVAGKEFTVDKTAPVVSQVTFDNNNAKNGNYYKANRTATITIVEHNFDASRAQVVVSASGDANTTPKVSGFTTNGDTHTATVSFTQDGVYTIAVDVTDSAGNKAKQYRTDEFVLDKTIGKATITGVKNKSANREKDLPITVSFTDTNADDVELTLKGDKTGTIETQWTETAITDGYTYNLDYFTKGGGKDDMYTLTVTSKDKAGNATKQSITFSINRDGSVYTFSDETKAVLGAIVKEVPDIIITETNVDKIDSDNVAITATIEGGDSLQLEKGKDYTITENDDGQWKQYVYTINKDTFSGEGSYILEIMSKDDTGRTNQSSNQEKITFTVDKNEPMLVVKDIKEDTVYNEDNHTIRISVSDMSFESMTVSADGLNAVYTSEEVQNDNGEIEVVIPGDTKAQTISIKAVDAAGNETVKEIKNVLITTNVWAQYINNTWLVVGSILLLILIIGSVIIIIKKSKKEED